MGRASGYDETDKKCIENFGMEILENVHFEDRGELRIILIWIVGK
jgi:hypothetical protein